MSRTAVRMAALLVGILGFVQPISAQQGRPSAEAAQGDVGRPLSSSPVQRVRATGSVARAQRTVVDNEAAIAERMALFAFYHCNGGSFTSALVG